MLRLVVFVVFHGLGICRAANTDSVYKLNYHVYSDNALRTQLERPGVLLNRSALVWKATVAAGVAVNLLPTSAGISIYSTGHDTIFNVDGSRYAPTCTFNYPGEAFKSFWLRWSQDEDQISLGAGRDVGESVITTKTFTDSRDATDLQLVTSGLRTGHSNVIYYPHSTQFTINRQLDMGEWFFVGALAQAEAIVFGVSSDCDLRFNIYTHGRATPFFRVDLVSASPTLRVHANDDVAHAEFTLSETALPDVAATPKFYWIRWDVDNRNVDFGEGLVIGQNLIVTSSSSVYAESGVEFDSIQARTKVGVKPAYAKLVLVEIHKLPQVYINQQEQNLEGAALRQMVDGDVNTCVTLKAWITAHHFCSIFKIKYTPVNTDQFHLTLNVYADTKCKALWVYMDYESLAWPTSDVKMYERCQLDETASQDRVMCRFSCAGPEPIQMINILYHRVSSETPEMVLCDLQVQASN